MRNERALATCASHLPRDNPPASRPERRGNPPPPIAPSLLERPSCEGATLARWHWDGIVYGHTLCEAADTAEAHEGMPAEDMDLVPEYRRRFLIRVGVWSWEVKPPPVEVPGEPEARCFIDGVNEGIRRYAKMEQLSGKLLEGLTLLGGYLSARSLGQVLVSSVGAGRLPQLVLIRGGGKGGPSSTPPGIATPGVSVSRPLPVTLGGKSPAAAAAPLPAPAVTPVAPLGPRPVLVHSQPAASPAPLPAAPSAQGALGPAAGIAAVTQPKPEPKRPECQPKPVCPHRGGNQRHDLCADRVAANRYPGCDVLVNGKHFDTLSVDANILWEIKTEQFSTYSAYLKRQVVANQLPELQRERDFAAACGFSFIAAVVDEEHQDLLRKANLKLTVVRVLCESPSPSTINAHTMNNFLVFKPKCAIHSVEALSEENVEALTISEFHALLREVLPDIGDPQLGPYGEHIDYRFGEAPVEITLGTDCIGLVTFNQQFPDVRELLRRLRAAGLVVFDTMTGQLVTG